MFTRYHTLSRGHGIESGMQLRVLLLTQSRKNPMIAVWEQIKPALDGLDSTTSIIVYDLQGKLELQNSWDQRMVKQHREERRLHEIASRKIEVWMVKH